MRVGDLVTLVRGNTYKSSFLSEVEGPVLLGLGSIQKNGGFKQGAWKHYPGPSDPRILLQPGDLYVSLKDLTQSCDLLGAVARVPDNLPVGRLTQDTVKLEFNAEATAEDKLYVYWGLRTPQYRAYCKSRGIGTTNMSLTRDDFLSWELPKKSKDNDTLISLFENVEARIALNNRINGYLGALCEEVAARQKGAPAKLEDLCYQVNDKMPCLEAVLDSYVSTESLLTDKRGRQMASSLPTTGKVTEYRRGDTLVSNIRPYFKKVWFADQDGTCSGDVIVFRARNKLDAPYVYSLLRADAFFEWVMLGSKGTKMPRGDKKQMMAYPVSLACDESDLSLLSSAAVELCTNERQNARLSNLRNALLPKLMSGEIDVSEVKLTPPNSHLCGC